MLFVAFFLSVLSVLPQVRSVTKPGGSKGLVSAAWYAGWHATEGFPLSDVSWDKYNTLIYSFAETTPSVHNLSLNIADPPMFPEFVKEAHKHNVAAHIAVGGWTGGRWFSSNVATPENRTAFVKTVIDFAKKYDVDGVNLDWEYPGKQGIGCNVLNADDTRNYLSFLRELRKDPFGAKLTLSAATLTVPFADASGKPSTDVSGFAEVFDYITIMNYDVWGPWSPTVGPNSPLNDTCAAPANRVASAVSAVTAWHAAGFPLNKIVLGVGSYGHSYRVSPSDALVKGSQTELALYPTFNVSNEPLGDSWSGGAGGIDECGVYEGPGGTYDFWGLVQGGFLTEKGDPQRGIYYKYDTCTQTPYVYDKTSEIMVSYDSAQSFAIKGKYIKETGLRGFAMWEAGGDYNDILLDSIRYNAGFDC